jgi:hypothetical protein
MSAAIDLYKRLTTPVGWSLYAIPLRLVVGFGFMQHGYAKLARRAAPRLADSDI